MQRRSAQFEKTRRRRWSCLGLVQRGARTTDLSNVGRTCWQSHGHDERQHIGGSGRLGDTPWSYGAGRNRGAEKWVKDCGETKFSNPTVYLSRIPQQTTLEQKYTHFRSKGVDYGLWDRCIAGIVRSGYWCLLWRCKHDAWCCWLPLINFEAKMYIYVKLIQVMAVRERVGSLFVKPLLTKTFQTQL